MREKQIMCRPFPAAGAGRSRTALTSVPFYIYAMPIQAKRSAIGLQTVCVSYLGDACVGDKGRPVIGKGNPGIGATYD